MINKILLLAAILASITSGIHLVLGGRDVATPLLDSALPEVLKLTLYAVWHMATASLLSSALAFWIGSFRHDLSPMRALLLFVSLLWCAFGLIFIVIAMMQGDYAYFLKLPQWILLLPTGLLGLWGSLKAKAERRYFR